MVIPSRIDNLPNTGVEALSCGTPVVAFNTCGLPDIVQHKHTGYLAKAFEPIDMAQGIKWVLETQLENTNLEKLSWLSMNSRQAAISQYSNSVVVEQYLNIYRKIIG
jgi:glycosyltransferase involved in cell wall biosynthesis